MRNTLSLYLHVKRFLMRFITVELTYEEIKKAQKRLMEECEKLKKNGGNQNQQTGQDENVSTNP